MKRATGLVLVLVVACVPGALGEDMAGEIRSLHAEEIGVREAAACRIREKLVRFGESGDQASARDAMNRLREAAASEEDPDASFRARDILAWFSVGTEIWRQEVQAPSIACLTPEGVLVCEAATREDVKERQGGQAGLHDPLAGRRVWSVALPSHDRNVRRQDWLNHRFVRSGEGWFAFGGGLGRGKQSWTRPGRDLSVMDTETGLQVWGESFPGKEFCFLESVAGGLLVGYADEQAAAVELRDPRTGRVLWTRLFPAAFVLSMAAPCPEGILVLGSGRLPSVDPEPEGDGLWVSVLDGQTGKILREMTTRVYSLPCDASLTRGGVLVATAEEAGGGISFFPDKAFGMKVAEPAWTRKPEIRGVFEKHDRSRALSHQQPVTCVRVLPDRVLIAAARFDGEGAKGRVVVEVSSFRPDPWELQWKNRLLFPVGTLATGVFGFRIENLSPDRLLAGWCLEDSAVVNGVETVYERAVVALYRCRSPDQE